MKGELHLPDLPEVPVVLSPLLGGPLDEQQRRTRPRWSVRVRESVMAYLPLLLMVLLAPSAPAAVKHEPDYTLDHFNLQRFNVDGALKVEIEGDHMQHFPDDDIMEVEKIRVVTTEPDGRKMTATAQHGRARGDSSEVWLDGQAQVVSESVGTLPVQMNGEHLHALPKLRRVDSTYMVIVRQGDDEFNSDGLEYDDNTQLLTLHGNVHALIQPAQRGAVADKTSAKK